MIPEREPAVTEGSRELLPLEYRGVLQRIGCTAYAWEIVDLMVTLALGLAATCAIATGKAVQATAATLLTIFHGLRAGRHWRLR